MSLEGPYVECPRCHKHLTESVTQCPECGHSFQHDAEELQDRRDADVEELSEVRHQHHMKSEAEVEATRTGVKVSYVVIGSLVAALLLGMGAFGTAVGSYMVLNYRVVRNEEELPKVWAELRRVDQKPPQMAAETRDIVSDLRKEMNRIAQLNAASDADLQKQVSQFLTSETERGARSIRMESKIDDLSAKVERILGVMDAPKRGANGQTDLPSPAQANRVGAQPQEHQQ